MELDVFEGSGVGVGVKIDGFCQLLHGGHLGVGVRVGLAVKWFENSESKSFVWWPSWSRSQSQLESDAFKESGVEK